VLVKLNVRAERLEAVLDLLPAMRSPTVSQLADNEFLAVETVVRKNSINVLIPRLKSMGAEDIVEMPIAKIVP
jgi:ATP phosphoribosyltransferase